MYLRTVIAGSHSSIWRVEAKRSRKFWCLEVQVAKNFRKLKIDNLKSFVVLKEKYTLN